ncbi:MAG TPA: TGS domain-containing protein, partial [Candidatus Cloacimonadota bacterium]|nr:TGS domain-containing protein [Candidatus Cloacimonadota bacterium]
MIKISLPDGSQREYAQAVTVYQVAQDISKRLADAAVCAEVEGKLVDMDHVI